VAKKKYVIYPLQNEGRWNYTMGKTAKGYTVILNKKRRYGRNEIEHECHCDKSRTDTCYKRRQRN
jgi:hypothetical protein